MLLPICGTVFRRIRIDFGKLFWLCPQIDTSIVRYERAEEIEFFVTLLVSISASHKSITPPPEKPQPQSPPSSSQAPSSQLQSESI